MKKIGITFAIAFAVTIVAPLIGSTHIQLGAAFSGVSPDAEIFFLARLPRVLLALLAGAALSATGSLFQCMLRDPLAEPYTLGVSSGASVGAVIAICLGMQQTGFAAVLGAAAGMLLVIGISLRERRVSAFTLLLTGVTLNSMAFAVILFLHSTASFSQAFAISRWLMGGLDAVPYSSLAWLAGLMLPVLVLLVWMAPQLNLLALGDEWAESRGVNASAITILGYIGGAVLTGLATAMTGPIAFVGLLIPHALRLIVGADHRVLLPCSIFAGAAFLCVCDTVARVALAPSEIPVGVITAFCGGPFFLWLLRGHSTS